MRELRLLQRRTLVRISWEQILSLCDIGEMLIQLSQPAETLIIARATDYGMRIVANGVRALRYRRDP